MDWIVKAGVHKTPMLPWKLSSCWQACDPQGVNHISTFQLDNWQLQIKSHDNTIVSYSSKFKITFSQPEMHVR